MPRFRRILARLAPAVLVLLTGQPVSADWKILYYDSEGRAVGIEGNEKQGERSGGTRQEYAPAGRSGRSAPATGKSGAGPNGAGGDLANLPANLRFEAGQIIVSDPPKGFETRARQLGFSVLDKVTLRTLSVEVYRMRVPRGTSVPAAVTRLRRQFPGLSVDANHLLDPSAGKRTAAIFARSVMGWGKTAATCGRGLRLGAIDGAVDVEHPALNGRNLEYRSFHGASRRPGAMDHGTAIAAMLIGKPSWGGLLPAAELKHANIFEVNENGRVSANVFGLMKAVDWIAGQKVHVINLSVAGSSNQVLDKVLIKAHRMGYILVAAAGNGGPAAPPAYPAAYHYVIAVTAVDVNQSLYAHANRGRYVDFAAPGVDVWTAVPGGGRAQSGTSFAAPYVSVIVALNVAKQRTKTPDAARKRLMAQLLDLGTPGRDEQFGFGLIRHPRDCSPQVAG